MDEYYSPFSDETNGFLRPVSNLPAVYCDDDGYMHRLNRYINGIAEVSPESFTKAIMSGLVNEVSRIVEASFSYEDVNEPSVLVTEMRNFAARREFKKRQAR